MDVQDSKVFLTEQGVRTVWIIVKNLTPKSVVFCLLSLDIKCWDQSVYSVAQFFSKYIYTEYVF